MGSRFLVLMALILRINAVERIFFSVKEEEEPGSLVGILLPRLSSRLRGYRDRINFQLIQKGDAHYFRVAPQDGRISLAQLVDREAVCRNAGAHDGTGSIMSAEGQCQLRFTVSILREGTSEIVEMVQVTVTVLDINDNQCRFEPSDRQTVYIPEDVSVDSSYRIPLYIPVDPDSAVMNRIDPRSVALQSGDDVGSSQYFDLHVTETSSVYKPVTLHLLLTRKLDFETLPVHKLVVTASDASRMSAATCSLQLTVNVVDVNDHPPRFTKKIVHLNLDENTPVGSLVHQLQASDQDGGPVYAKLIFAFATHTPDDAVSHFDVHPMNGSILLKRRLSYRKKRRFELPVVVRNPSDDEVIIGSNDELPQLKTSKTIQVETTVHDTAQVIIDVVDVNDESPSIAFYAPDGRGQLSIEENAAPLPSDFGVVSVTDGDAGDNGRVECSLGDSVTGFFRLIKMISADGLTEDGRETLFKLTAIRAFDREEQTSIGLAIFCRDFGVPQRNSSKNLIVQIRDVNDNSPVFDRDFLELNITEDSDPSRASSEYAIGRVLAHDPDEGANAEITYTLLQSSAQHLFTVDPRTGVFSSNGELDREMNDRHQFVIVARDSGTPQLSSSVTVIIHVEDFNDEPPVFALSDLEFVAIEGTKRNTLIGTVDVTDADLGVNGKLTFKMLANDLPAHYPIASGDSLQHYNWRNEETVALPYRLEYRRSPIRNDYEVSIFADGELDAEAATQHMEYSDNGSQMISFHSFFIVAEDGGTPRRISRARVVIHLLDINDNAPVFTFPSRDNTTANVSYNEYVGYPFTQVAATDADAGINGTVQYFLGAPQNPLSLPEQTLFQVHRANGQISLKRPLSVSDFGHAFNVHIVASDMSTRPLQTRTTLTVLVDNSEPKGARAVRRPSSPDFTKSFPDSMINLLIIVFIVVAAFIISAALLTAVCIILNKSRRRPTTLRSTLKKGGTPPSNDCIKQDLYNAHLLSGLAPLPTPYMLARTGDKVYRAIPLVSTASWSPASCSSASASASSSAAAAALVYVSTSPMASTATEDFCATLHSCLGTGCADEVHTSTLPLPSPPACTTVAGPAATWKVGPPTPRTAYSTRPTHAASLACEDTLWMDSQERLFDKLGLAIKLHEPGSNDQDSGHGDSLDTAGATLAAKPVTETSTRSPFVSAPALGTITNDGASSLQSHKLPECDRLPENLEEPPAWSDVVPNRQQKEVKTLSTTREGCSTFI